MEARSETVIVKESHPGERLDSYLRDCFPAVSRGAFQRLIEEGHIRVDGKIVKCTHSPRKGEEIFVHWPSPKASEVTAQEIALEVLYEDEDLIVINKPPGLVVHPAAGHEDQTIVNALLHHCAGELSGIGGVSRPGIVHRLDKDTSGCLVAAKNDAAHLSLSVQFKDRHVKKLYQALVCGIPSQMAGEIRAAIHRHPTHRKRMAITESKTKGREAWTSYRVLQPLNEAALVEADLHTGRTHQIRVHFQHLGHPLVGDLTYGAKQNKRLQEKAGFAATRQMLHAAKLAFAHPRTGKQRTFTAPTPADFSEALAALARVR